MIKYTESLKQNTETFTILQSVYYEKHIIIIMFFKNVGAVAD